MEHSKHQEMRWIINQLESKLGITIVDRRNRSGIELMAISPKMVVLGQTSVYLDWNGDHGPQLWPKKTGCFTEKGISNVIDKISHVFMNVFDVEQIDKKILAQCGERKPARQRF